MTQLSKPIRRITNTLSHAGRALVIEVRPGMTDTVFLREQGRRSGYAVPISRIYALGARLHADAARAANPSPHHWKAPQGSTLWSE